MFLPPLKQITEAAIGANRDENDRIRKNLKAFLQGQKEIRILVANSPGYGNQSGSVNILRQLISAEWKDEKEEGPLYVLALYCPDDNAKNDQRTKIGTLIPQFKELDIIFLLGKARIMVVALTPQAKLEPQILCGLTGGWDSENLPTKEVLGQLNITTFLQLQTYAWDTLGGNQIMILEKEWISYQLDTLDPSPYLNRRTLYLNDPQITASDWELLLASDTFREKAEIVQYLLSDNWTQNTRWCPAYGITTAFEFADTAHGVRPEFSLYNLAISILHAETTHNIADISLIVVLDDIDLKRFKELVQDWENSSGRPPSEIFKKYHKEYEVSTHIKTISGDPLTREVLEAEVKKLKKGDVLVIKLGKVPMLLFNALYAGATLPPAFEGQGTAEIMLNLGKAYFKDNRRRGPNDIRFGYPTLPLAVDKVNTMGPLSESAAKIASSIFGLSPGMWSEAEYGNPIQQSYQIITTYTPGGSQSAMAHYFAGLKEFFHNKDQDKLFIGLKLYRGLLQGANLWPVTAKAMQARIISPLEQLYNDLQDHIREKVLHYLDAVTTGLLHTFFAGIVIDGVFRIDDALATINSERTEVTLIGKTQAFGVGNTELSFRFVAPDEAVVADFNAAFTDLVWSFADAQWLSISSPGLTVTLDQDSIYAVRGAFTARVSSGFTMDVEIPLTSDTNIFVFQGSFAETRPSFASLFQMVGGLNLQLPLLSGWTIEVQNLLFAYNLTTRTMEYIGVRLGTSPDIHWSLVPGVEITGISLNVTISLPAKLLQRPQRVSYLLNGQFAIGDGTAFIYAFLPNLRVSGGLMPDSKPISLANLIKIYLGDQPLPPEIGATSIDALDFVLDQPSGIYSFSMNLDTSWPIEINGSVMFKITELGFEITAFSSDLAANTSSSALMNSAFADDMAREITGGFSGKITILPETPDLTIDLVTFASYLGNNGGWRFEAIQTSGTIPISALLATYLHWDCPFQLDIDGLALTIETATNSFEFSGRAIGTWQPPIQDGISFQSQLRTRIGYNGGSETLGPDLVLVGKAETPLLFAEDSSPVLLLPAGGGGKQPGWFGEVSLDLIWNGIELTLFYNFDPAYQAFGITCVFTERLGITGYIEEKEIAGQKHQIATLQFTETTTLGGMVETMVSWLTGSKFALAAPWSVLNSVSLNRVALVYDFTADTVSFDIAVGPLELGIARIEALSLSYRTNQANPAENGVIITLKGSFLWQSDPQQPLSWDAARPETTPAPPGSGNKYLDLRLLALGQHIRVEGLTEAQSVQQAIDLLRKLPLPQPGERPGVSLDPNSSWLIGAEFGVLRLEENEEEGYFLTLQVVFTDPRLYGLRLKLEGKAAKILTGLDFQILYRQVSETVGVYQAEITLPTEMRRLSIGAYTLTLPVFGIAVYTNGDFQLDLGFPWNADFSRSFSIEALIFPGIPLLGSAGLYFGKLSSGATNLVPTTTKGLFDPILVFGLGAQMGFGKSLEYGVLKAGFSLTIVGLLEGVLAKWNPYAPVPSTIRWSRVRDTQMEGEYYFWLRGALGISGKLYGSVDFAIIKADVTVQIILLVQITFESYQPLVLTVQAAVDVSVMLQIDLGFIKINISLTFSLQIKETFTILSSGTAPWSMVAPPRPGLLSAPLVSRLRAMREMQALPASQVVMPNWSNLAPAISPVQLRGYLAPAFTVAGDAATRLDEQEACAVALLLLESVPPVTRDTHSSRLKARGQMADTSFELLCKQVLRWVIAAMQDRRLSAEKVDLLIVSDQQLLSWLTLFSADDFSLPLEDIEEFLNAQFRLLVHASSTGEIDATFFPMAPALGLDIPNYGAWQGYRYTFAEYNVVATDFLARLRTYFNELAVQVQREEKSQQAGSPLSGNASLSIASFLFGDYFLLLCRQMLQAARSALRDFTFALVPGMKPGEIVDWVNTTGELGGAFTGVDLFTANPTHPLQPERTLILESTYQITAAMDGFVSIASALESAFTPTDLALSNATQTALLRPGAQVHYPGQPAYPIQAGDDLLSVARHYRVKLADLLSKAGLLEQKDLLRGPAALFVPSITYQALVADSLMDITHLEAYGGAFTAIDLAMQNAGRALLRPGKEVTYPGKLPYVIQPGDCLGDLANAFEVSLTELLEETNLLLRPDVLAPATVLVLPPFNAHTRPDETLQSLARRLNTTIEVLAASAANLAVQDLFDIAARPTLDLPHLPQFRVKELLEEIQGSLGLQQISGMTSRYYLHGLRLPTAGITPRNRGMWVKETSGVLTLPAQAGLYALSGQQFPLPTIEGQQFSFFLVRPPNLQWLVFDGPFDNRLILTIDANSADNRRLQVLRAYARSNRLPVELAALGQEAQLTRTPATYALTSALAWQAGAAIELPYGRPSDGVSVLRLWQLPVALTDLPDPHTRALKPRFRMLVARYDEASGTTVNDDLASYGWASTITFTVKKVPLPTGASVTAALRTTCEIVGASGSALVLLERLLSEIGAGEDPLATLLLGYAPEQTGNADQGIQTDAQEAVTMGIAQVNLSTETRPTRAAVTTTASAGPILLNSQAEFLRLLWEASITRAGGFYLYYYNAENGSGLPERIFNDKGEATLTLIVLYRRLSKLAEQNCLSVAMNALVTAEPLETAQAVIFAEADPMLPTPTIPALESDTLADLAFRYYGDVAELAEDNANVPLTVGKVIIVAQGLYEVPPTGVEPGGNLARIAAHFGTTVQAIKEANPRLTVWPDPLPLFQAIRLPHLQITVDTSPYRQTLRQLAHYYGETVSALAADNQKTPGLFAAGQPLVIAGGPVVSRPSVPAGVLALETRRPEPPPVPVDPTHQDYARLSLLHLYTLLSFQVSDNAEFHGSGLSLPSGPTTEGTARSMGKIRIPRELAPGDLWTYRQALPYPQLVRQVYRKVNGLPDPARSPYRALGRLLQLDMAWQDLYGNRLMTTLSHPSAGDAGPLNRRPYLTGYTDLLLGLNQWPAISAGWQVLPEARPRLEVLLNFDDSLYQGLLAITASSATLLRASFTLPLDPDSAVNLANYRLDTGTIQSARLLNDGETVELIISALPAQTTSTLTVENIKARGQDRLLSGQASCQYPDDPAQRTSTLQEQARRDLAVYTILYYQLNDPNGIALTLQTSLLDGGRLPLSNIGSLLAWIGSIYTFLADRAGAGKQAPLPQKEYHLGDDIPPGQFNEQHIFALTLAVQITRTGGLVAGDLATVSGLREVTTEVAPLVQRLGETNETLGLTIFASRFEQALSVAGTYQIKVATGVDRFRLSPARTGSTLWAVRLSLGTDTTGISFTIANPGAPTIFVPRPVSNRLASQYHVPIYDYTTDRGIDFSTPRSFLDFVAIDLGLWVHQVFAELDGVLTPEFTAAIQLLDLRKRTTVLADLLAAKKALASLASELMIPVFADEQVNPRIIQQVFEQQLLQQLSNAYTTSAGLQFQARVHADIQPTPGQLSGTIMQQAENENLQRNVTLTSPKLPLQTGTTNPLAFLLTASEVLLDDQGQVMRNLPLHLSYQGEQIEHQIGKLPGIEDYLASSWLSFVLPAADSPLTAPLGQFPVPLVLRTYPESPTMLEQVGTFPQQPGDPLTQLTRWNYGFTYSLPFHYPQDTLFGMAHFNVPDALTGEFHAAFNDLAEFVTVFPAVRKDLRDVLATIDAGTTDEKVLTTAAIAVASFRDLVKRIVKSAQRDGGLARPPAPVISPAQASYAFSIQEGCIQREGVDALLVTLRGQPPAGLDAPQVLIEPETYEVQPFTCAGEDCGGEAIQGDFCFWYRQRETGQPLSAVAGQRIQERLVVLTGLDLFAAQDSIAWTLLQRNEGLAEPFVYTTGRITFANPFHPTSDSGEQVINIATIGSGTPPHPVTRSFAQHLKALFAALLQKTTQPTLVVQAEIHYEYALHPELRAVPLPILLQPPHPVNVANVGSDTLDQMITTWEKAIQKWGATYDPQETGGTFWFDLTIMSELTSQPQPLLRLRFLCLPLATIDPPLWQPG